MLGVAGARARHDELVRDSEAQFRELADTTPALMWMTDAEGDVTFVNKAWLRFTGGSSDMGVTFEQTAHPDDREAALRRWEEASRRREQFRCEYRLRHGPSDGYRWVLEVGRRRHSRNPGATGTLQYQHDPDIHSVESKRLKKAYASSHPRA